MARAQHIGFGALWAAVLLSATSACAQTPTVDESAPIECASGAPGYLKAKVAGAVVAEIDWKNKGTTCTGEARPNGGVRMSFKNRVDDSTYLIVFGIPELKEGRSATALAANLTLVREGTGEFYSTQGTDKCTIDRVEQTAIKGAPHKARAYRVVARGFCTEPARALQGNGSILVSRFDFAGIVRYEDEEAVAPADPPVATARVSEESV